MSARTIEQLERRLCMDGNVQAAIVGGDLLVRGDDEDNNVIIQRLAGKIRVTGLEETTINGGSFREFAATFDDMEILMRQGGEDAVLVHGGMKINGDLAALMGDGSVAAEGTAGALEIGGNLYVRGGELCDVAVRNEVIIRGRADIATGGAAYLAAARATVPDFASARFSNPLDIDNPYLPLLPGARWEYEETSVDDETGETIVETNIVEVTNRTKTILGVVNRVVRDRVFVEGLLVEDTSDWHAQDDNGNVWYFGEQSTDFEYDDEGNPIDTSTEGWQAGVNGAKPGIVMLAKPAVGRRYYQEVAPGNALDYGQVLVTDQTAAALGETFDDVVRTQDRNLLEPDEVEHKLYAPGVGLIREFEFDMATGEQVGELRLTSLTRNGNPVTQVVPPTGFVGTNASGRVTGPVQVFGETLIRAGDTVVVDGARFDDEVEIAGESEVLVWLTQLEDLTIRAGDTVGLRNVTAEEEVELRGDVDVFIFFSRFQGDVDILLGADDNELAIRGSRFADLFADGGGGENEFDDRGGNRFDELDLRRFDA